MEPVGERLKSTQIHVENYLLSVKTNISGGRSSSHTSSTATFKTEVKPQIVFDLDVFLRRQKGHSAIYCSGASALSSSATSLRGAAGKDIQFKTRPLEPK